MPLTASADQNLTEKQLDSVTLGIIRKGIRPGGLYDLPRDP
jgi:hypothetical protein